MDLEGPLPIKLGQGLVLGLGVTATLGLGQQLHRHRRTEHGKAAVKDDHTQRVQKQQGPIHGCQRIPDLGSQDHVGLHGAGELIGNEAHQDLGARGRVGRNRGCQGPQHQAGHGPASVGGGGQGAPIPVELDLVVITSALAQIQAAAAAGLAATAPGRDP